ncbi:flagellar protein FlhE [Acerihabitans sp. KWT182]|uniref:Flagellar protein FlhE n=1 Tax=Acerihabitans sp. KWT182 TaxID=3157919 RepID=A0AAU7Q5V0_9GAMM
MTARMAPLFCLLLPLAASAQSDPPTLPNGINALLNSKKPSSLAGLNGNTNLPAAKSRGKFLTLKPAMRAAAGQTSAPGRQSALSANLSLARQSALSATATSASPQAHNSTLSANSSLASQSTLSANSSPARQSALSAAAAAGKAAATAASGVVDGRRLHALSQAKGFMSIEGNANGGWSAQGRMLVVNQRGAVKSSPPLRPLTRLPAGAKVSSVNWRIKSGGALPSGVSLTLCMPAKCLPLDGLAGRSDGLAGMPADDALVLGIVVAGTGVLFPPVVLTSYQVQVNYTNGATR